jgi:type IV secretory pathway protease TraF
MANISRSKINLVVFLVALILLGTWIPSRFSLTVSKSLDHRLFFLSPWSNKETIPVVEGSYVLFQIDHPLIAELVKMTKTNRAIKRVTCAPGSVLYVENREYFCDGRSIGKAKEYTSRGVKVRNFVFNDIIPKGNYFVMGDHPDSFDSRYFGFIENKDIMALAYPIL